jgi:hypothetical protein
VELARLALYAYGINQCSVVIRHWLDRTPARQADFQLIDEARSRGLDVSERTA